MTPRELRAFIKPLPEYLPHTKAMEEAIQVGSGYDGAWYRSKKEHWLGWLAEYDGAGAYGRSAQTPRNSRYAYNQIQCAPMLFWFSEALGTSTQIQMAVEMGDASQKQSSKYIILIGKV